MEKNSTPAVVFPEDDLVRVLIITMAAEVKE